MGSPYIPVNFPTTLPHTLDDPSFVIHHQQSFQHLNISSRCLIIFLRMSLCIPSFAPSVLTNIFVRSSATPQCSIILFISPNYLTLLRWYTATVFAFVRAWGALSFEHPQSLWDTPTRLNTLILHQMLNIKMYVCHIYSALHPLYVHFQLEQEGN